MQKEEIINQEQINMLDLEADPQNSQVKKESNFFTRFLDKQKNKPFRIPKCQISRGLVTGIGSIVLFSCLCIWYLYEDDLLDYNNRNSTSNLTFQNQLYDNYEAMHRTAAPIQYVLLITVIIVIIIIFLVFIGAITHHIRSRKEEDITINNLKCADILRGIFASNKNQHRTQLYYLENSKSGE